MLLNYSKYLFNVKNRTNKIPYTKFSFLFHFFQKKKLDSLFYVNFRNFPRKISAVILEILDLKIIFKNILRFIAFVLIFHLVFFFNVLGTRDIAKITLKFFLDYFCNSRKLIFWTEPFCPKYEFSRIAKIV